MRDFGPVKVVISGAGGGLGSALYRAFLEENKGRHFDYKVIGIVDNEDESAKLRTPLAGKEDAQFTHRHAHPEVYLVDRAAKELPKDVADAVKDSDIWVYFRGVPTKILIPKYYADEQALEKAKSESGLGERGLLLEANLPILVRDVKFASTYAPGCRYIVEGNPVEPLGRIAYIRGVENGNLGFVCSAGTRTEEYRVPPQILEEFRKELGEKYGNLPSFEKAVFTFIGGHGEETAKFVPEASHIGGVDIYSFVTGLDSKNGIERLGRVIKAVHEEPYKVRKETGATADSAAPITVDFIEELLGSPHIGTSGVYAKSNDEFGVPIIDKFVSLTTLMGYGREPKPVGISLKDETRKSLEEALAVMERLDRKADRMLQG